MNEIIQDWLSANNEGRLDMFEETLERNAAQAERIAELEAALVEAIDLIEAWHNMGVGREEAKRMWAAYQQSPEMKRINAALGEGSSS